MKRALLLFAALTLLAVVFASQLYAVYQAEGFPIDFGGMLVLQLVLWYPWELAGPLAWAAGTRWPIRGDRRLANLLRHGAIGCALGLMVIVFFDGVSAIAINKPATSRWFETFAKIRTFDALVMFFFAGYFHIELLVYGSIVAVANAVSSNRELRDREHETLQLSSQLTAARLPGVAAPPPPPFLFHTLHTTGSLL